MMKITHQWVSCIILSLTILGFGNTASSAQRTFSIYAISLNHIQRTSTLWELDTNGNPALAKFSLPMNTLSKASDVFSPRELSYMKPFIERDEMPEETLSSVTQVIKQVQQLDEDRALVIIAHEICNRNIMNLCFGYYELQLIDTTKEPTATSLLKIDYHPVALDEWKCLAALGDPIVVEPMLINPTYEVVAITLHAYKNCYIQSVANKTLIVDFSTQPSSITMPPMNRGLAWSPTGNKLAYYAISDCSEGCAFRLRVSHFSKQDDGKFRKLFDEDINSIEALPSLLRVSTVWLDESTLLYQWYDVLSNDLALLLNENGSDQQLSLKIEQDIALRSFYHTEYGALVVGSKSIVPITFLADAKVWGLRSDRVGLQPDLSTFYNPRRTDVFLFANIDGKCLKQVNIYTSSTNSVIPFDLSGLLSIEECIISVAA